VTDTTRRVSNLTSRRKSAGNSIQTRGKLVATAPVVHVDETVLGIVSRFVDWLDDYGEVSYDHQSYYASAYGRWAKALYYRHRLPGTIAVSPMVFSEAFLPSARRLFWKPQRFPIADAHYAMGFAFLSKTLGEEKYYRRAVHFLEVLKETRCPGFTHYCWGYPFDWETANRTIRMGTPMITTVPYVYEAFREVYRIDGDRKWLDIMASINQHILLDYYHKETSATASSCSYIPSPEPGWTGVVNASAYRAAALTQAAYDFGCQEFADNARRNLSFVIESQNADGSWYYSKDGLRDFVDHFHTCFVLKALAKIERLTGDIACTQAIERGVEYYLKNLADERLLPKPFSRRPRMTVYRREAYDFAEHINLAVLLRGRFPQLDRMLSGVLNMTDWQKPDGSFRSRQLHLGWDDVPMHRWAQSQWFRSLCFLLCERSGCNSEAGQKF
jgi:hypothetical protein